MNRNSTIKPKKGICPQCSARGDNSEKYLIYGLCANIHYKIHRAAECEKRASKKAISSYKNKPIGDISVETLKADLDLIFSRWLRLAASDYAGYASCFICGKTDKYAMMDAGHYIPRGNSYLRYDPRNVKVNCKVCNQTKYGNLVEYARRLEEENPGITSILEEEANIAYKFSREELKGLISEYSEKLSKLK